MKVILEDGGPMASQMLCAEGVMTPVGGLSKREYFAAMAMQAILSNAEAYSNMSDEHVAENACDVADALLVELNKEVES